MANVGNPRKVFMFQVEIDGLNQFECQKFTPPEASVEKVEHGDTNYSVKTPGRFSIDDIVLEKLRAMPNSDMWAWDWLMSAQNPTTGGGQLPSNIKKTIVVRELDSTGLVVINTLQYDGCWVTKVGKSVYDRMSGDNVIETVTISLDVPSQF